MYDRMVPASIRWLPATSIDWIAPAPNAGTGTGTDEGVTGGATGAGGCCAAALSTKEIARRLAARNRETVLSCKRLVSPFANLKGRIPPASRAVRRESPRLI
jgi:hypothetical protein